MTRAPRPADNIGGLSFAEAPAIAPHTVQYGSLHQLEPGQLYKIHLNGHESIAVSGQALGFQGYGTAFHIDLYDAAHQLVQNMTLTAAWGDTAFPSGAPTVYTNPGASSADYYVKLWCQYSPTHDFHFSVEAAGTSGGTPTDLDQVQYYHTDAIGSVRAITDSAAQLVARYDYLPFGDEWLAPPVQDSRLFAGQERDPETDFDYFGARYFSANVGRFTTVDPVLNVDASLLDPQRWNAYAYTRNNPLRLVDPDGRDSVPALWRMMEVLRYGANRALSLPTMIEAGLRPALEAVFWAAHLYRPRRVGRQRGRLLAGGWVIQRYEYDGSRQVQREGHRRHRVFERYSQRHYGPVLEGHRRHFTSSSFGSRRTRSCVRSERWICREECRAVHQGRKSHR